MQNLLNIKWGRNDNITDVSEALFASFFLRSNGNLEREE